MRLTMKNTQSISDPTTFPLREEDRALAEGLSNHAGTVDSSTLPNLEHGLEPLTNNAVEATEIKKHNKPILVYKSHWVRLHEEFHIDLIHLL